MIYLCKCGAVKHASPWRSAITKPMICDKCAGSARRPLNTFTSRLEKKVRVPLAKFSLGKKST